MDDIPECKLSKIESLEDYFSLEYGQDGECRPCRLQPLASLYLGTLEGARETKQAEELSKIYDGGDILTIAKKLDTIKSEVGESLRKDLMELDCFAQSYKEAEET